MVLNKSVCFYYPRISLFIYILCIYLAEEKPREPEYLIDQRSENMEKQNKTGQNTSENEDMMRD